MRRFSEMAPEGQAALREVMTGDGCLSGRMWRLLGPISTSTSGWSRSKQPAPGQGGGIETAVSGEEAYSWLVENKRVGLYCAIPKLLVLDLDFEPKTADLERLMRGDCAMPEAPLTIEQGGLNNRVHAFYRADKGGVIECRSFDANGRLTRVSSLTANGYLAGYDFSQLAQAMLTKFDRPFHVRTQDMLDALPFAGNAGRGQKGGESAARAALKGAGLAGSIEDYCTIILSEPEGGRHRLALSIMNAIVKARRFGDEDADAFEAACLEAGLGASEVRDIRRDAERFGARSANAPAAMQSGEGGRVPSSPGQLDDVKTSASLRVALTHVTHGNGGTRFNIRTHAPEVQMESGWEQVTDRLEAALRDRIRMSCFTLQSRGNVEVEMPADFRRSYFDDAFNNLVHEAGDFDPFLEWLKKLKWDGKPRIATVLHRLFKAEDCEAVRYASRQIFVRAVMRAMHPGIESDRVVVLRGGQGSGKSTFFEELVPVDDIDGEVKSCVKFSFGQALGNAWNTGVEGRSAVFVVLDEVWGRSNAERSAEKEWLTRKSDDCRLPYERRSSKLPRRFAVVGTVNQGDMMPNDASGSRRWMVVDARLPAGKRIEYGIFYAEREQWWAEAYADISGSKHANDRRKLVRDEYPSDAVTRWFAGRANTLTEEGSIGEQFADLMAADNYERLKSGGWNGMSIPAWANELDLVFTRTDRDGEKKGRGRPLDKRGDTHLVRALTKFGFEKTRRRINGEPKRGFFFNPDLLSVEMRDEIYGTDGGDDAPPATEPPGACSPPPPADNHQPEEPMSDRKLPFFVRADGREHASEDEDNELLEKLVMDAAWRRFDGNIPEAYASRITHELDVLKHGGAAWTMLEAVRAVEVQAQHGFPIAPGRGSVVSSVCSWLLGCSHPDPVAHGLDFARFATVERLKAGVASDIDINMVPAARPYVVNDLRQRYGNDRVLRLSTYSKVKPRKAVRQAATELCREREDEVRATPGVTLKSIQPELKALRAAADAMAGRISDEENDALTMPAPIGAAENRVAVRARTLVGTPGPEGTHPAAVVVLPQPAPVMGLETKVAKDGGTNLAMDATQADGEAYGKLDHLGDRYLGVIDECQKLMGMRGTEVNVWQDVDVEDTAIYGEMNDEFGGIGLPQLNGWSTRRFLPLMQPRNFADLTATISLTRPGVSAMADEFLARRAGERPDTPIHPAVAGITADTHGLFVYQEQLTAALKVLAGFSDEDAGRAQKACSKKVPEKMAMYARPFCEGVVARHGLTAGEAAELWETFAAGAAYAFNRAHATAFATLAAWAAWLRQADRPSYFETLERAGMLAAEDKEFVNSRMHRARPAGESDGSGGEVSLADALAADAEEEGARDEVTKQCAQ